MHTPQNCYYQQQQSIDDEQDEHQRQLLKIMQQMQYQQQPRQQLLEDYVPTTLNDKNKDRCAYLPTFPYMKSSNMKQQIPLLLANVSTTMLGANDLSRRYGTCYEGPLIPMIISNQMESYVHDIIKKTFNDLMERLKINKALVDFNAGRFQRILERFQLLQNMFYRRSVLFNNNSSLIYSQQDIDMSSNLVELEKIELNIGLEFFLQIDVDVFYMKTCSFRDAHPRSLDEGLFCKSKLPTVRYYFQPCQEIICTLCESSTTTNLQFNLERAHRFLNGYYSILNCPATCQTKNIIYSLTCPCGEYDFIGSTSSTIGEVIEFIRENGNYFMHETLISVSSFLNSQNHINDFLNNQKEFIRLYQHSTRCAKAIQLFLNMNSQYDCFIPMTYEQAMIDDINQNFQQISTDNIIESLVQHVPMPPNGYTFSNVQRQQQRKYFKTFKFVNHDQKKLWTSVDFYNITVIAVLPENCSTLLRQVIECLFVTHAETKLNMFNLHTTDVQQLYGLPYHRVWCENIIRPLLTTS